MTFSGLLVAIYQLKQSFLQQRAIFENSIKKEHFDITFNLDSVRLQVDRLTANTDGQTIKITDSYLILFADDNSAMTPPDPFPNSEVKHRSAGSPM